MWTECDIDVDSLHNFWRCAEIVVRPAEPNHFVLLQKRIVVLACSGIKMREVGSGIFACEISDGSVKNFQPVGGGFWTFGVWFCGVRACFDLNRVAQTAGRPFFNIRAI